MIRVTVQLPAETARRLNEFREMTSDEILSQVIDMVARLMLSQWAGEGSGFAEAHRQYMKYMSVQDPERAALIDAMYQNAIKGSK